MSNWNEVSHAEFGAVAVEVAGAAGTGGTSGIVDTSLQSSPGANLAAARQAYGLTIEQIANQLNLAPRQIVALESDDYAALPAAAIARGFFRSYAKLMRLDPVPLLALLGPSSLPGNVRDNARSRLVSARVIPETRTPETSALARRIRVMPAVAGFATLALAALVSYAMGWLPVFSESPNRDNLSDRTNAVAGGRTDLATGSSGAVGLGTGASGTSNSLTTGSFTTDAGAPLTEVVTPGGAAAEVLPAVSIGVLEQSIDGSRLKTATSIATDNPLVLNIRKDSWVEIRRADNTPVVAKILKGGSVETFDVSEPLTLTIGNVAGVEASLRGAPLALASADNTNVARLKLK
ncbi:MAG: RodZ domain-containing protein [Pseudomonadota bacterium]